MKLIKNIKHFIAFGIFGLLLLMDCTPEAFAPRAGENTISITIDVPGAASSRAIAGGSADDNAINRIDVLIFKVGGAYLGRVSPIVINGSGATRSFTIPVPEGNLDLVILANSRDRIDAIASNLVVGATARTAAYALLTESLPATNIWNAQSGSTGYKPFPMWGEALNINVATTPSITGVELVRALAKINVRFLNSGISDRLTIAGVSLYNFHTTGYLASWGAGANTPTAISDKRTGFANGLAFPASVINGNQIIDEIFLFEVAPPANPGNPTVADRVASTSIIISGFYKGDNPANTAELSYYRIDLRDDAGVFLGVTRNSEYDIIIRSVTGAGANTGEIAYDSESVNITATVRAWDAGDREEVDYGGEHLMRTGASRLTFLSEGEGNAAQSLNIFSDHPGGWVVEPGYPDWFHLSITAGNNITEVVDITCTPFPDLRTGEFFIRTEGLRKRITVAQVPFSQPDPPAEISICLDVSNTINLDAAVVPDGAIPDISTITYRWETSIDDVVWTVAATPDSVPDYTIDAGILMENTYFRRVAIWNGFEIVTTPVRVLLHVLRTDIPDFITIGIGANARIWSTRNLDTPGVFAPHASSFGKHYQAGTIRGVTNYWSIADYGEDVPVPGWNSSNFREPWTEAQEPCILARREGSPNWRLPIDSEHSGEFHHLLDVSPRGSDKMRGQNITQAQAGRLGLGCSAGRLFGPNVDTVIRDGNVVPDNFDPNTMLFIPATGWRLGESGVYELPNDFAVYWSSGTAGPTFVWSLAFGGYYVIVGAAYRGYGCSIRCVAK